MEVQQFQLINKQYYKTSHLSDEINLIIAMNP